MKSVLKLDTQKIKGKDYVLVNERVRAFRSHPNFKDMSIETSIVDISENRVVMVAKVLDPDGLVKSTGHAEEIHTKSGVNSTSFIENCETSAVGRCLGFLGIGVDDSIATYEEVEQAIGRQESSTIEGVIRQNENLPLWVDVKWPGQQNKGKTLSWLVKNKPDFLKDTLKTKYELIKDQDTKLLSYLEQAVASISGNGKQDFADAK
jgi:hypothetical protein